MKTKKMKYIVAYLDGYFSDKKVPYGMQYYSMLDNAISKAKKKWKKYENNRKGKFRIRSREIGKR